MTHRKPIQISRRALALALVATGGLGVGAGELAGPLAASQATAAHPATVPTACRTFATDVAGALQALAVVVKVEGSYALFIPKAYKDGQNHDTKSYASIETQLLAQVKKVNKENTVFRKLQGPLISNEKTCLAG
jgi:hypothetical protein